MMLDFANPASADIYSADIVIVGGGAVGLSIYADLVRRGKDVLLLEAGGESLDTKSQSIINSATNSGHLLEGLHLGRYRFLGGTTNFWAGQLIEFDPIVFETRPWLSANHWLCSYDDLRPFYRKAMVQLGMKTAIESDTKVWERAALSPPDLGDDVEFFFTRWIRVTNFARLYQPEIHSKSGRILLNANVLNFMRPTGRDGHRICIRTFDGRIGNVAARRIILALGTIETCRLLLMPYSDGSSTPWNGNPWLGRGYIDHIDFKVGDVTPIDFERFSALFENMFFDGHKYTPKIKLSPSAQRQFGLVGLGGAFVFKTSYKEHSDNINLFVRSLINGKMPPNIRQLPMHVMSMWRVALPMAYRYVRYSRMFHPKGSKVFFRVTAEQYPLAESRISLNERTDPLGSPTAHVHWKIDGRELESVAYFAEAVRKGLKEKGLAELIVDPRLSARDPSFLDEGDDTNHQMGGCRMAGCESEGVVDANCRVYGAEDIFVAGAAVMPSSGFPNCTLTSIALGLRLGEHVSRSQ